MVKILFKVVLIGDGAVGKTSLRRTYMGESFRASYMVTIGADFAAKTVSLDGGHSIQIQIWDLAGQAHFANVRSSFYRGAQGAMAVYSTVERASFLNLTNWLRECWNNTGKMIPVVIIGNKVDLREQFKNNPAMRDNIVTTEEGMAFTEQIRREGVRASFIETSAKTGHNVEPAFLDLVISIIDSSPSLSEDIASEK